MQEGDSKLSIAPNPSLSPRLLVILSVLFFGPSAYPGWQTEQCIIGALKTNDSVLQNNNFVQDRPASFYADSFGDQFVEDFTSLPEDAHYMESGAALGRALKEMVAGFTYKGRRLLLKARKLTAVGVKKPSDFVEGPLSKEVTPGIDFDYVHGHYLEDPEFPNIGTCDLIVDVYGPFSYTGEVSLVLRKYLRLLKVGGKLYIRFNSKRTKLGGQPLNLKEFLSHAAGLKVDIIDNKDSNDKIGIVRIEKVGWTTDEDVPSLSREEFQSEGKGEPTRDYKRN